MLEGTVSTTGCIPSGGVAAKSTPIERSRASQIPLASSPERFESWKHQRPISRDRPRVVPQFLRVSRVASPGARIQSLRARNGHVQSRR